MPASHLFHCTTEWTGGSQGATLDTNFSREFRVNFATGKHIEMSAAPEYKGDAARLNPEELFTAALSSCQMLTYLHLAARQGIKVFSYTDEADGELALKDGKLRMVKVTLRPYITISADSDVEQAKALVEHAHHDCFIANSVTCDFASEPVIVINQGE